MSKGLREELYWVGVLLALVALIGWIFGVTRSLLLIALLVYISRHLYNVHILTRWLNSPSRNTPESTGVWDEIYSGLYHLYQRQRKARRRLTTMLSRFKESTQALPYATVVLNERFEIDGFNSAAKSMYELRASKDIGQRIDNLIRQPGFVAYMKSKQYDKPLEFSMGESRMLLTLTAYGNGQYLMITRDITERTRIDAMRRDFIANASHELKTPITVISGYVETMRERSKDEQLNQPLEKIQIQAERMQLILSELLELAKLESADHIEYPESVDTASLLQEIYQDALAMDDSRHEIKLTAMPITIEGDREELRMAFSNLVTNALRYTPEKRAVKIFSSVDDAGVSVGVEDEGIGITYEHLPRLTERFYRIDPGRSRDQGGTGLGLAIVKHVLDRHDGELIIRSTPGRGSVFRCHFPHVEAPIESSQTITQS
jgi:two-component system, OmpR family, phosphate regulon sensor histidine kinase PhoR